MSIPVVKLANGLEIPQLGLGLWQVTDQTACEQTVQWALEAGYRHFDTAQIYGNEAFLGSALARGGVPRDRLFITTKIWNENQSWNELPLSFDQSLKNLQTDYIDLLLLHFPVTGLRRPAWRKMEEIVAGEKARAIGVSNYTICHLEELLSECDLKPAVNQVEIHVFLQQSELVEFCHQQDILIEAYSPLAHGYGMDNPVLRTIAAKHAKTAAQIMIRWCIEQDMVALPKTVHSMRIKENLNVFDFSLDEQDMSQLKKLERNYRTCWDPTNVP